MKEKERNPAILQHQANIWGICVQYLGQGHWSPPIDLWRISPASEAPGSLGQMSKGNNTGFLSDRTVNNFCRWQRSKNCVTF